jgi:transmembrane sensor
MSDEQRSRDRLSPRNVALSDEAIDWIVCLGSGSATTGDLAAFEEWRSRSPAHAEAAAEAAAIMADMGRTRQAADYREIGAVLRPPPSAHRFSRRALMAGGVASVAAFGLVGSGAFGPASGFLADYSTGVGGRKRVVLADGSVIWLNSSTALSIDFSAYERRLTLHAGEALFEVAKDKARPFIVMSGSGEARAVGTVYSVRRRGAINDVVVTEGIVEVRNGSDVSRLTASQHIAYGEGFESKVLTVDGNALTAWTRGKLIFNRRPLGEVVAELERYQHGAVIIRDDRLKRLEVTGVFDLDDPKALLMAISVTIGVPVTHLPFLTVIG